MVDSYVIIFFLAAFILLVLFRYLEQHVVQQLQEGEAQVGEKEHEQEPMVTETEEKETQHALVVKGTTTVPKLAP